MNINDILHSFVDIIKSYLGENYALKSELSKVPIGTISWVMGENVPTGYLICNGQNVSRESYPKLFEILGTRYGEGDGETTFGLPNLIGKFLQGDTTSGTVKEAGLPNITGHIAPNVTVYNAGSPASGSFHELDANNPYNSKGAYVSGSTSGDYGYDFDASRSNSIYGNSSTVQPPAVTSIPCIKAFDTVTNTENLDVSDLLESKLDKSAVAKQSDKEVFGKVPYIGTDGVVELGKYIDFHSTMDSTVDYNVRLTADTDSLRCTHNFKVDGGSIYVGSYQIYVG